MFHLYVLFLCCNLIHGLCFGFVFVFCLFLVHFVSFRVTYNFPLLCHQCMYAIQFTCSSSMLVCSSLRLDVYVIELIHFIALFFWVWCTRSPFHFIKICLQDLSFNAIGVCTLFCSYAHLHVGMHIFKVLDWPTIFP